MNVTIHRDFPFLSQWKSFPSGSASSAPLGDDLRGVIDALTRDQRPPVSPAFAGLAQGSAVPYDLGDGHALITLQAGDFAVLYAVGDQHWVREWLVQHTDVRLLVEIDGERVRLYVRGDVAAADIELEPVTHAGGPLLPRLTGIDWQKIIGHRGIARRLLGWDGDNVDELHRALNDLEQLKGGTDRADLVLTVIHYLMSGRDEEAKAAVQSWLGSGHLVDVRDAPVPECPLASQADPEQIAVLNNLSDSEIDRLLSTHFQDWMQFLHPEQKKIVDADHPHPVVLRGVSGSGKTVVLVHRACRLARKGPQTKVLAIAWNHDLAMLIYGLVSLLAEDDELPNLTVLSLTGYLRQFIQQSGYDSALERWTDYLRDGSLDNDPPRLGPAYRDELFAVQKDYVYATRFRNFLGDAAHANPDTVRGLARLLRKTDFPEYLRDEVNYARSLASCWDGYAEYLTVNRRGRAIRFDKPARQRILELTRAWERYQWHHGFLDPATMFQMVRLLIREGTPIPPRLRFDHILVDEFQDLSTLEVNFLAEIPEAAQNGLFFAGDDAQRVCVKQLRLADTSVGQPAYRSYLRKNYRNTVEVLEAANALMSVAKKELAKSFDDRGEDFELLEPQYSSRHGPKPRLVKSADPVAAAWQLAASRAQAGSPPCSICLVSLNEEAIPLRLILDACPSGWEAGLLTGAYLQNSHQFVISDVLGVKGFEFSHVLILGAERGVLPRPGIPEREQWRDVLRLYAVMTRARNEIHFFYRKKPSSLLKLMRPLLA